MMSQRHMKRSSKRDGRKLEEMSVMISSARHLDEHFKDTSDVRNCKAKQCGLCHRKAILYRRNFQCKQLWKAKKIKTTVYLVPTQDKQH